MMADTNTCSSLKAQSELKMYATHLYAYETYVVQLWLEFQGVEKNLLYKVLTVM